MYENSEQIMCRAISSKNNTYLKVYDQDSSRISSRVLDGKINSNITVVEEFSVK